MMISFFFLLFFLLKEKLVLLLFTFSQISLEMSMLFLKAIFLE